MLREQVEKTLALFAGLEDEHATNWSYEPGKWSLKQVLGHMSDTERIFSYRMLRIARGDGTPLPSFEQDGYVQNAEANALPISHLMEEFRAVRRSTLLLLEGLPEEAWTRKSMVSDLVASVRGIAFTAAGHELHHFRLLQERYQLKLAS